MMELFGKTYSRVQTRGFTVNGLKIVGIYTLNKNIFSEINFSVTQI